MLAKLLAFAVALCAAAIVYMAGELRTISGQLHEIERLVKLSPVQQTPGPLAKQPSAGEKKKLPAQPKSAPRTGPPP